MQLKAGIIGLGLMGGSLGLALKEQKKERGAIFSNIIGLDINETHCRQALYLGLVDECVEMEKILECDVIFLATPIKDIINILRDIKTLKPSQLLMELGGVKGIIKVDEKIKPNFLSVHPMCGTENFGPKSAFKELFKNQIIVFNDPNGGLDKALLELAKKIFIELGMNIVKMNASEHDHHAALISHMPHIVSYSLVNAVLKQESPKDILAIAGGGFKGMSRIAKSSGTLWAQTAKYNKVELLAAIKAFSTELQKASELIENEDYIQLEAWMNEANSLREIL